MLIAFTGPGGVVLHREERQDGQGLVGDIGRGEAGGGDAIRVISIVCFLHNVVDDFIDAHYRSGISLNIPINL